MFLQNTWRIYLERILRLFAARLLQMSDFSTLNLPQDVRLLCNMLHPASELWFIPHCSSGHWLSEHCVCLCAVVSGQPNLQLS